MASGPDKSMLNQVSGRNMSGIRSRNSSAGCDERIGLVAQGPEPLPVATEVRPWTANPLSVPVLTAYSLNHASEFIEMHRAKALESSSCWSTPSRDDEPYLADCAKVVDWFCTTSAMQCAGCEVSGPGRWWRIFATDGIEYSAFIA
jgi:hypothetical protein